VLGEEQYGRLRRVGYLDLPSQRYRGRVYRLDSLGRLSYRDAGETTFHATLCVQPEEEVPRDDEIAMRYLLVTADEDRLLEVANPIPIGFGFFLLARAQYQAFRQRYPPWLAALLTTVLMGLLPATLVAEIWIFMEVLPRQRLLGIGLLVLFFIPALIGLALIFTGAAELIRAFTVWRARHRLER